MVAALGGAGVGMPRARWKGPLRGWVDADEPARLELTVYDMEPVETGLLGPDGEPIYQPGMGPIGFVHWPQGIDGLELGDPLAERRPRKRRRKAGTR